VDERLKRRLILGVGALAVLAVLATGGAIVWAGGDDTPARTAGVGLDTQVSPSAEASQTPSPESATSAAASPSSAAPSRSRTRTPPPSPSKKATQIAGPPPPPTATKTTGCPTYAGPKAPMPDVKVALDNAAARTYWPVSAPSIRIPVKLLYATAWQESGWQSTIIACDGGIGTMQIMPATATWMNQRFETSWNVDTLSGNVFLGGQFLAWLVKYFGDVYYGENYDFYDAATGEITNEGLLNAVIAAYNVGHGAVDPTKPQPYPNTRYVQNVRALMVSCPCTAA